ncbi:hypothetical protein BDR07DRAFT_1373128, partial [Suillus spraguei]
YLKWQFTSKFNTRFSPYARASPRALRSSEAHEIQELEWGIKASLKSYQLELQRREDDVGIWIGSDMDIDLPMSSASGTYGCVDTAMEDEEHKMLLAVVPVGDFVGGESEGHQFPKRRRLVRGLHKTVEKYMQRHLDTKDPRTDQVRERVHIALQAALVCVDVNDVVLPMQSLDGGNKPAQQTDDYLIPYAIANRIVNGVTSGLQLLGIALSTTSKDLKPTSRAVSTIWQFVLLKGAGDFLRAPFLARHSHFENCNPTVPTTLSRRPLLSFIVWVLFRNSRIV